MATLVAWFEKASPEDKKPYLTVSLEALDRLLLEYDGGAVAVRGSNIMENLYWTLTDLQTRLPPPPTDAKFWCSNFVQDQPAPSADVVPGQQRVVTILQELARVGGDPQNRYLRVRGSMLGPFPFESFLDHFKKCNDDERKKILDLLGDKKLQVLKQDFQRLDKKRPDAASKPNEAAQNTSSLFRLLDAAKLRGERPAIPPTAKSRKVRRRAK